jgi:hypothetical protein
MRSAPLQPNLHTTLKVTKRTRVSPWVDYGCESLFHGGTDAQREPPPEERERAAEEASMR